VLSANTEIVGGNFRLVFDGDTRFSRWLTQAYVWKGVIRCRSCTAGSGRMCYSVSAYRRSGSPKLQDACAAVGDWGIADRPNRLLSKGPPTLVAARDYLQRPDDDQQSSGLRYRSAVLHNPVLMVRDNRICGSQGA
jgi:hypothetical protein